MIAIAGSKVRRHFKKICKKVVSDVEVVIVTRSRGKNIVMISEAEYNNMMENFRIFSSPGTYQKIKNGIQQYEQGKSSERGMSKTKLFTDDNWNDYLYWQQTDKTKVKRIKKLIKSIEKDGYAKGLGKPQPLKHDLSGYWSRRIDEEHRIIYRIHKKKLVIVSCKDYY